MKKIIFVTLVSIFLNGVLLSCKKNANTDSTTNNQVTEAKSYSELPADVKSILSASDFDTLLKYDFPFYLGDTPPNLYDAQHLFVANTPNENKRNSTTWSCVMVDDPQYNAGNCIPNNIGTPLLDNRFYFQPSANGTSLNSYACYYLEDLQEEDATGEILNVPNIRYMYSSNNLRLYGSNNYFSGVLDCSINFTSGPMPAGRYYYYIVFSGIKSNIVYNGSNVIGIKNFKYLKIVKSPSPATGRPYGMGSAVDMIDNDGVSFMWNF